MSATSATVRLWRAVTLLSLSLAGATALAQDGAPTPSTSIVYGLDFSAYLNGQSPVVSPPLTAEQISSRLRIVAPYTTWIRTMSSTNGMEQVAGIARQMGLKIAGGCVDLG